MNPWKIIDLEDYESHMKFKTVQQLQILNSLMRDQIATYDIKTICILGVAGGNGLEHIKHDQFDKVYGIDINSAYLCECKKRYNDLSSCLELIKVDLTDIENSILPNAQLLIANLIIEYIGINTFIKQVSKINPMYISIVIQVNGEETFVSDSPYQEKLNSLNSIHQSINKEYLTKELKNINYALQYQDRVILPNGKMLIRLDYQL